MGDDENRLAEFGLQKIFFRLYGETFVSDALSDEARRVRRQLPANSAAPSPIEINFRGPDVGAGNLEAGSWVEIPPPLPGAPDFRVFRSVSRGSADFDKKSEWQWRISGGDKVAVFHLKDDGGRLDVKWTPGSDEGHIKQFCFYNVLGWVGRVLYRGLFLHASSVRLEGCGIVICGASGQGKSTLAAALGTASAEIWSDDISAVRFEGDTPHLMAGVPPTPEADATIEELIAPNEDGILLDDSVPLRLVIVLSDRQGRESKLLRLSEKAALLELVKHVYPRGLLAIRDLAQAELAMLSRLVRNVPCYQLERPEDLSCLSEQCRLIDSLTREGVVASGDR